MPVCPKCGFNGENPTDCPKCGISFAGYQRYLQHHAALHAQATPAPPDVTAASISQSFLGKSTGVCVQQNEAAAKIFVGWPSCNHYTILTGTGEILGFLGERKGGLWTTLVRFLLNSRRPLVIDVADASGAPLAQLNRNFFWFFSEMLVLVPDGAVIGAICRRWGVLRRYYTIEQPLGQALATLQSTVFGGKTFGDAMIGNETFTAVDPGGRDLGGSIYRQWNGALNRIFTDEDTFVVEFAPGWSAQQKLVFLAAAISLDFDFYESKESVAKTAERTGILGALFSMLFGRRDD